MSQDEGKRVGPELRPILSTEITLSRLQRKGYESMLSDYLQSRPIAIGPTIQCNWGRAWRKCPSGNF
ncbi:hypothetical protein [Mariniradius saccharolyticus]|uniref:hypothetical protein n=1 Tax=Mariniradius saccharolyticus TaxID=1245591 RepID=UPI0012F6A0AA|nr:hypothetical protein [Mariniradius saccharolyticus]